MKLTLIPAQYLEQSIQYPELSLCRIVSQEKGLYRIISTEGDQLASVSGKFQHEAASPSDYPVVGDYVMAALNGGAAVINRVLPAPPGTLLIRCVGKRLPARSGAYQGRPLR